MKKPTEERRRYFRVSAPINIKIITDDNRLVSTQTKNISPIGIRFEAALPLKTQDEIDLTLGIPGAPNPVHARARVIWQKKTSLENNSPADVGCEFIKIEEDNKNTFLMFFCDILYGEIEGININKEGA